MKKYVLYWLDGTKSLIEGNSISEAMNNNGYSHGSIRGLDFYSESKHESEWEWNKKERTWKRIKNNKPMCCGTELINDKCSVCGDNFKNI